MPDTCFCDRCIAQFEHDTDLRLPEDSTPGRAQLLLGRYRAQWVQWRCDLFTDWVRQYRALLDQKRPTALLGTFHCPWNDADFDGALRDKLAIDLKAQAVERVFFGTAERPHLQVEGCRAPSAVRRTEKRGARRYASGPAAAAPWIRCLRERTEV